MRARVLSSLPDPIFQPSPLQDNHHPKSWSLSIFFSFYLVLANLYAIFLKKHIVHFNHLKLYKKAYCTAYDLGGLILTAI